MERFSTCMRDIEAHGGRNLRDPNYIRQLLQASQNLVFESSRVRGCLVTILCILILRDPIHEQEIRLVKQYLEIIGEEMNVIYSTIPLTRLPIMSFPTHHPRVVTSCLLSGTFPEPYYWKPSDI